MFEIFPKDGKILRDEMWKKVPQFSIMKKRPMIEGKFAYNFRSTYMLNVTLMQ